MAEERFKCTKYDKGCVGPIGYYKVYMALEHSFNFLVTTKKKGENIRAAASSFIILSSVMSFND